MNQLGRRQLIRLDGEALFHLRRDLHPFCRAREDATALRDQRGVVIGPRRARQVEQALALDEAARRVGVGIDEDMQMVERGHQLQGFRHQQTVAEHIASHVADTDDADHVGLHIDPTLAEMTLHGDPGAARGNTHLLVVVARRAA